MVKIEFEIESLKGLREDLCTAQSAITQAYSLGHGGVKSDYIMGKINRIQTIIDQIDVMRPLGPDGKHKDRHTVLCGCDVPFENVWHTQTYFPNYEMQLDRSANRRVLVREKGNRAPVRPMLADDEIVRFKLLSDDGKIYYYAENLLICWLEELESKNG